MNQAHINQLHDLFNQLSHDLLALQTRRDGVTGELLTDTEVEDIARYCRANVFNEWISLPLPTHLGE